MSLARWDSLGYIINHVARLFADRLSRRIRRHGVTIGQFPLLLALWEEEGISQAELSRRLDIEPATTNNTLRRMERDGLVTRRRDANDQRSTRIYPTGRGRELEEPLTAEARAVNARASRTLSGEEAAELHRLLGKVIRALEREEAPLPGSGEGHSSSSG
ncbi:MarR family winged helix-turn-helix transcriptional regulator [Thiohalorhabdus methylotrophus]|uniref:MarR family winged helix-turn-helix transcriptional regulator n=1 Tax=Thiohalorhabdus methylotrophus TaxID=3242694 RepID=A0ABV4TZI2_9GAMM